MRACFGLFFCGRFGPSSESSAMLNEQRVLRMPSRFRSSSSHRRSPGSGHGPSRGSARSSSRRIGPASSLPVSRLSSRTLGPSFTGDVRASADQQIVVRGAYAILRHPAYAAGILMNTGLGIALGSWAAAGILGIAAFLAYSYRIVVEERALVAAIGEPYLQFMRTRKRLIPFVY